MVGAFNEQKPIARVSFYDTYLPIVKIRVRERLGNMDGDEDVVNDIFLEMLSKSRVFATQKNIENYLMDVIRSKCNDFKKKRLTPVIKMDHVREFNQQIEDRLAYLAEIKEKALAARVMAMEILSPHCKEVFLMFYIQGYHHREIALLLGISEKTVARHLEIAHAKLKMEIKKDGGRMFFIQVLLPMLWAQLNA